MKLILLLACAGFITEFFVLFRISPSDILENIFKQLERKPQSLKESLDVATNRKKQGYLKRELAEVADSVPKESMQSAICQPF